MYHNNNEVLLCICLPVVNLLQMLDLNVTIAFPAAPLFTVILSLVGKSEKLHSFLDNNQRLITSTDDSQFT